MNCFDVIFRYRTCLLLIACLCPVAQAWGQQAAAKRSLQSTVDFDGRGRKIAVHRPDGTVLKYEYASEAYGGSAATRDLPRAVAAYRRDESGGLTTIDSPDARVTFKYDANGALIEARNGNGKTEYFRDEFGRPTKVRFDYPKFAKTIAYEYSPTGNVTRKAVTTNGGKTLNIGYEYDGADRLKMENINGLRIEYHHDSSTGTITRKMPDGVQSVFQHNTAGQLDRVTHLSAGKPFASVENRRDSAGRLREQITRVGAKEQITKLDFGQSGQISSISQGANTYALSYGSGGALRSLVSADGRVNIQRDGFGRVSEIGTVKVDYDALDRPTSFVANDQESRVKYSPFGQMSEVHTPAGALRNQFSADGMNIGSEFAGKQRQVIPDIILPTGRPVMTSGDRYIEAYSGADLSIRFQDGNALVKWHTPSGHALGQTSFGIRTQSFGAFQPFDSNPRPTLSASDFSSNPAPGDAQPLLDFSTDQLIGRVTDLANELSGGGLSPLTTLMDAHSLYESYQKFQYGGLQGDFIVGTDMFASGVNTGLGLAGATSYFGFQYASARMAAELNRQWTVKAFEHANRTVNKWVGQAHFDMYGMTGDLNELAAGIHALAPGMTHKQLKQWDTRDPFSQFHNGWSSQLTRDPSGRFKMHQTFERTFGNLAGAPRVHIEKTLTATSPWELPSRNIRWTVSTTQSTEEVTRSGHYDRNGRYLGKDPNGIGGRGFDADDDHKKYFGSEDDKRWKSSRIFHDGGGPDGGGFGGGPFDDGGFGGGGFFRSSIDSLGKKFQPKGVKFDKPAEFYGILGSIQGVCFDPKTKRITLLGDGNTTLPPVRVDDFQTAVRVVYGNYSDSSGDPEFSLEPADPANPAGEWLRPVYRPSLLRHSHIGDVMLRADWILKQYSLGVLADYDGRILGKRTSSVPGYQSHLERVKRNPQVLVDGKLCNRFWIVPGEMRLEQQGNTLVFTRAKMRVKTERMEMSGGRLQDSSDKADPTAEAFAAHFTEHYDEFAAEAPVLEEARQAAKVVAIVKLLKKKGVQINDFTLGTAGESSEQCSYGKRDKIRSVSLTESAGAWGLPASSIYVVGGVHLAPRPVVTPGVRNGVVERAVQQVVAGPAATSVSQVDMPRGMQASRYIAATVPITASGCEFIKQHPVCVQDGVTYAGDAQKRVRHMFDSVGNSASFDYGDDKRLAAVHFRDSRGWRVDGNSQNGGQRQISVHAPKGDRFVYRLDSDGLLVDAAVNDRTVARAEWNDRRDTFTVKHIAEKRQWKIGDLGGMKTVEEVVQTESLFRSDNEVRYERTTPGETSKKIVCRSTEGLITIEGDNVPRVTFQRKGPNSIQRTGPGGKTNYEFDPENQRLKRVEHENGDFVEWSPPRADNDAMSTIVRAKRGDAEAHVRRGKDRVEIKSFDGSQTVYQYRDGRLQSVASPTGTTTFEYADDGEALAAIHYPGSLVQRFQKQSGVGATRLTTWWEHKP